MGPTNNTGFLLQHLAGVLSKQNDQALQERLGIGFSQFKILRVLEFNPSIQQKVVAQWLGQTEASISRQIKIMIDKGLLVTSKNPKNRRENLTNLTNKGLRLNEEAIKVLNSCHSSMFEHLGDKKQNQLLELLSSMHHDACITGKVGACAHPYNS